MHILNMCEIIMTRSQNDTITLTLWSQFSPLLKMNEKFSSLSQDVRIDTKLTTMFSYPKIKKGVWFSHVKSLWFYGRMNGVVSLSCSYSIYLTNLLSYSKVMLFLILNGMKTLTGPRFWDYEWMRIFIITSIMYEEWM